MSNELYSQQKEIKELKNEILNLSTKIEVIDEEMTSEILKEDKKTPHY